jgi:hypothetical protein
MGTFIKPLILLVVFTSICFAEPSASVGQFYDDATCEGQSENTTPLSDIILAIQLVLIFFLSCAVSGIIAYSAGLSKRDERENNELSQLRQALEQRQSLTQRTSTQLRQIEQQLVNVLPHFEKPGSRLFLDAQGNLRGEK